jgi:hypothetical protein
LRGLPDQRSLPLAGKDGLKPAEKHRIAILSEIATRHTVAPKVQLKGRIGCWEMRRAIAAFAGFGPRWSFALRNARPCANLR